MMALRGGFEGLNDTAIFAKDESMTTPHDAALIERYCAACAALDGDTIGKRSS